jgi:hypothetical protein
MRRIAAGLAAARCAAAGGRRRKAPPIRSLSLMRLPPHACGKSAARVADVAMAMVGADGLHPWGSASNAIRDPRGTLT